MSSQTGMHNSPSGRWEGSCFHIPILSRPFRPALSQDDVSQQSSMRWERTQAHEKAVGVGIEIAIGMEIAIGENFDLDADSEPDSDSDPEIW